MKTLKGGASADTVAGLEEVFTLLRDVESYPEWHGEVVQEVQVLARDGAGRAERVHARLRASIGPLDRGFEIMLAVRAEEPEIVILERLAHEPRDGESLAMRWGLESAGGRTRIDLQLEAALDVPRFLPLPGGAADTVARGFVAAAAARLGVR